MNASNTKSQRCGVFGVTGIEGSRDKVIVNGSSEWDWEDITIYFSK